MTEQITLPWNLVAKKILHPVLTIIGIMVVGVLLLVPLANAAPLADVVTENTSYIVRHSASGDRVTLLPSGTERVIDMTAVQVCAADNVVQVTIQREINDRSVTKCK